MRRREKERKERQERKGKVKDSEGERGEEGKVREAGTGSLEEGRSPRETRSAASPLCLWGARQGFVYLTLGRSKRIRSRGSVCR